MKFVYTLVILLTFTNTLQAELLSHEAAVYYRTKGYQYQLEGDIDKAIEFYHKSIDFDADYAPAHNDLGILYEERGELKKAETAYLKTLEIDPDYLNACTNLALLYEMQGRIKEAIPHWKTRASQGDPDDIWTMKAKDKLVMFKALDKKIGEEALLAEKIIVPEEEKEDAYRIAGEMIEERLEYLDGDEDLARKHYSQGIASFAIKDYKEALEEFNLAAALEPKDEMIRKYITLCEEKLQTFDKTALQRQRSRGLMKDAIKLMKENNFTAAKERLDVALKLDPNSDKAKELLAANREAEISYQMRRAGEERQVLERNKMKQVEDAWLGPSETGSASQTYGNNNNFMVAGSEPPADAENLGERIRNIYVPSISLRDADVRDLIRQLMEMTGVTIVLDEAALARATEEAPIKLTFSTVNPLPLSDLLDIALRTTNLDYKVEKNYIWISSRDQVMQEDLETKTYRLKYGVRKFRKVELKEFEEGGSPNY